MHLCCTIRNTWITLPLSKNVQTSQQSSVTRICPSSKLMALLYHRPPAVYTLYLQN